MRCASSASAICALFVSFTTAARSRDPVGIVEMTPMLPVRDAVESIAFYQQLGFTLESNADGLVRLRLGGHSLYLVSNSPPTDDKPGVKIAHVVSPTVTPLNLTFHVSDVMMTYQTLTKRGVRFLAPPATKDWGEIRVFTRDPDGYLVEFYQPL